MNWWAFFEREYGSPVGRLDVYDREWELPAPPDEASQGLLLQGPQLCLCRYDGLGLLGLA